jgi:IS30 family transposase
VRSLILQQAGFLEFGEQALRPLTLREIAAELGLHESTVSRDRPQARAYPARHPAAARLLRLGHRYRGGGEASSTAIQAMIRRLIDDENPRKPLSDAKLADLLKSSGIPVARRTVAKYREAMNISASHERVRIADAPPRPAERFIGTSEHRRNPMRIETFGKDVEVTPALQSYVEEKLARIGSTSTSTAKRG